jgi:hypothetical protein
MLWEARAMRRDPMARSWNGPMSNTKEGTEALSSTFLEDPIPTHNHMWVEVILPHSRFQM